ncbi:MAG: hypothetical protein GX927_07230 [Lentisphaerae bacterium]|mgnify:CR=1 FL=1|jgi:formate hydrogenlyase subunit 3/multisubunit Na+/H+ antiporter MnhD subunit|nr:hypothetical protein [Lentisphaerota bacterium]
MGMMNPAILAILLISLGGLLSLFCNFRGRAATALGLGSCLAGTVIALVWGLVRIILAGAGDYTEFISCLFLLPVVVVGGLSAVHAVGYMSGEHGDGRLGIFWFFYNLTLASMIGVTQASSPIPFLLAWEAMGLFSFALVAFDHHSRESMQAAWIYFLACHAGGALLLLMFVFRNNGMVTAPAAFFICGLLGFGLKAGFPLLHIWLPEAHSAAPAPVSALLSAGMINLGFYGILRWMTLPGVLSFGQLGTALLLAGMIGALLGITFALPQKNLKRLLAYSSIENMGIVGMGFGLGFLGLSWQNNDIALLGFCGAFLHLLNHATLKGGLFLAAGNVLKSSGLLNMDQLGGLQKRLPKTGTCFTLAAVGISGLPPGNAFFGEVLLYVAAGKGIASGNETMVAWSLAVMLALALCGGLAATVFAKAVGAVFQGEPRSQAAIEATSLPRSMTTPIMVFLGLSILMAVISPCLSLKMATVFSGHDACRSQIFDLLLMVLFTSLLLLMLFLILYGVRNFLLPRSTNRVYQCTWDCGFAKPTARMEYTGTAFVQPLVDLFAGFLRPEKHLLKPQGLFPEKGEVEITCEDGAEQMFWRPIIVRTVKLAIFTHRLQSGHLHLYILCMVIALLAMLIWGFSG